MDGTTEPILIVLGDPIAGNPSQLALERAFASIETDWRVVSLTVARDDLPVAMAGLRVCHFGGVWLDHHLARQPDGKFEIDCFGPTNDWKGVAIRNQFAGDSSSPIRADPFEMSNSSGPVNKWLDVEVRSLAKLVHHLVNREVDVETILDAIEEYQSV